MVTRQTNSGKAQSVLGMAIVAVGILMLAPKFIAVVPLMGNTFQEASFEVFNSLPSIGLGALHAGQALVFDPATFFAVALGILVSFWPLLLVTIGTFLLRNGAGVWPRISKASRVSSTESAR
jgi:hypothetical protein